MMTKVQIARWGNSSAIRLPKPVLKELGLKDGDTVDIAIEDGKAVIGPADKPRIVVPSLEELIADMDRMGWENEPETVDWGPDVGSEIIDDDDSSYR